jgi:hypothetical protein
MDLSRIWSTGLIQAGILLSAVAAAVIAALNVKL